MHASHHLFSLRACCQIATQKLLICLYCPYQWSVMSRRDNCSTLFLGHRSLDNGHLSALIGDHARWERRGSHGLVFLSRFPRRTRVHQRLHTCCTAYNGKHDQGSHLALYLHFRSLHSQLATYTYNTNTPATILQCGQRTLVIFWLSPVRAAPL